VLPRLLIVSSLDRGVLPKLLKGVAKSASEEEQLWKADAGAGLANACRGGEAGRSSRSRSGRVQRARAASAD
jgi:hypothetical protein